MTPTHRGRYSRAKGVRWERKVCRLLRAAGLPCRRVLEYDGHSHGVDIVLLKHDGSSHPIALQCKATRNPNDLSRGLAQAASGWPKAAFWACLHAYTAPGSQKAVVTVLHRFNGQPQPTSATLPAFLTLLKSLVDRLPS